MQLNQVLAIEKGAKPKAEQRLTAAHQLLQKGTLFEGISRSYRPLNDDPSSVTGEILPGEHKKVEHDVEAIIKQTVEVLVDLFDLVATKEWANTEAFADVVVDGQVLLAKVPVTYLLFLEHKLVDLRTFVEKLPVLPPGKNWEGVKDISQGTWATKPIDRAYTKKVSEALVLYPATDKHPAQVKEITTDKLCGYWTIVDYSSALPASRVSDLITRVEKLQRAVKVAREEANSRTCEMQRVGKAVLEYLFL